MIGSVLGFAAGALAILSFALFMRIEPEERGTRRRIPALVAMAVAMGLGVVALAFPLGLAGRVSAWLAVVGSGLFIGLRLRGA